MYPYILIFHSLTRWLVLISLILTISRAYYGWWRQLPFTPLDNSIRHWTATIAHIQLTLGIWLYSISPIIRYFLQNYSEAVHQSEIRFFGMEHSVMMLVAVIMITVGSAKAKRKKSDDEKFKTIAIWMTIGLILILTSIPWAFSTFVSRPYFRFF